MSPDSKSFNQAGGPEDDGFALTADPQEVVIDTTTNPPGTSADTLITATVLDIDTDEPLEGVEVEFSADAGALASGGAPVLTAADGTATDTLTVVVADPDSIEVTATESSADRMETTTVTKTVILPHRPPVADAGDDIEKACDPDADVTVTLDGSGSSDPDSTPETNDDLVLFEWFEDYGTAEENKLGEGETLDVVFDVGMHTITLVVTDSEDETDTDEVLVTITDNEPPDVSLTTSPDELWPPNHKMVDVEVVLDPGDCSDVTVELLSVTSSEPPNANGDGNTEPDIMGVEIGTEDYGFQLRAERAGGGDGRVYTVTYRVTDAGGLSTEVSAEVRVPHDQGGN
jgi:hypothetical protein